MNKMNCPPCNGNCNQGRICPATLERHQPLEGLTLDEHRQQLPSPWTGLNIALALVLACLAGVLVVHAAARAGWLQ